MLSLVRLLSAVSIQHALHMLKLHVRWELAYQINYPYAWTTHDMCTLYHALDNPIFSTSIILNLQKWVNLIHKKPVRRGRVLVPWVRVRGIPGWSLDTELG